jgi:hypothetical protein
VGDALATIGVVVSLGVAFATVVVALIIARLRRVARKNSELEELRDMNLKAMGYIYRLEMAFQEACQRLGVDPDWVKLDKPDILRRQYLAEKALNEGNREIAELAAALAAIQEQLGRHFPQLPTKEQNHGQPER